MRVSDAASSRADFCAVWHLFDLIPEGSAFWRARSVMRERRETEMTTHPIRTLVAVGAPLICCAAEKELTRRSDELARRRQEAVWVRIDREYRFETDDGNASLLDLFKGHSQLLVYHFMLGRITRRDARPARRSPMASTGPPCTEQSRCDALGSGAAPLAKLQAYKKRLGWTFSWASSFGSDFNFDFNVSVTVTAARGQRRLQTIGRRSRGHGRRQARPVPRWGRQRRCNGRHRRRNLCARGAV